MNSFDSSAAALGADTAFYIGAIALILAGIAFALWPLIKAIVFSTSKSADATEAQTVTVKREDINVALYDDHLQDLEKSLAQGNIDQTQFDLLKQELERNLIEDSQLQGAQLKDSPLENDQNHSETEVNAKQGRTPVFYIAAVFILLPLSAIGFYQWLGHADGWQLQEKLKQQVALEEQLSRAPASKSISGQLDQLNRELVVDLEKYVIDRPDDLDTKVLLARTAVSTGAYEKAIEVYQQVLEKEPQAAQMMAELAQAVFAQANNRAVPVVGMLAGRALNIQPNNVMALGLMGIVEFQNANYEAAIGHWQKAVAIYPPNSANGRALQGGIVQAQARLAAQPTNASASGESVSGENNEIIANEQNKIAESPNGESAPPVIKLAVSLGEGVPADPNHAVFIYARAWQGAKVPLAITRITAAQLPLTLELDDTMNMAPGMTLSSADKVEVIARLSPSGNAITQAGDWQVSIGPIDPKAVSSSVYPMVIAKPVEVN
ncbi:MAG: c-type cytochrome biogenesis protein CcmI [Cellvibrionaceae bacterium]